jgi:hypothetical protein
VDKRKFFEEECQLINIEGMMKLGDYSSLSSDTADLGQDHE